MPSIERFFTPLLIGVVLAALMGDTVSPPLAAQDLALENVRRTFGMIPMKDGVALSYVVYRPEADGNFPALFAYGPYLGGGLDLGAHGGFSAEAQDYLRHGYAVVSVSTRGTGCSTGSFQVLSDREAKDGAAAVEWIGRQPWCTGAVGLFGHSYLGLTQYMIASQRPKYLKTMVAGAAAGDPYRDMAYPGGIFNSSYGAYWSYYVQLHQERQGLSAWRRGLDLSCQEIRSEVRPKPTFHRMKEHPFRDTWWQARSFERMATSIEVPVLIIHAWQDQSISVRGAVGLYYSIQTPKKLLLANWCRATRPSSLLRRPSGPWFIKRIPRLETRPSLDLRS